MAAFVPLLLSKAREFSVKQCEMHTNALHEATDHTDYDSLQQQQVLSGINMSLKSGCAVWKPVRFCEKII